MTSRSVRHRLATTVVPIPPPPSPIPLQDIPKPFVQTVRVFFLFFPFAFVLFFFESNPLFGFCLFVFSLVLELRHDLTT